MFGKGGLIRVKINQKPLVKTFSNGEVIALEFVIAWITESSKFSDWNAENALTIFETFLTEIDS